ncbi:enhancer of rudimentary homolog [Macrosteles quadrilineatus]|uniref:enhancer of rudimentary homolog n=1 Tax=Macrosteles quadrilineatus TaxID=74068 RepID=UPI0023E17C0D|nr:enhancer of rudimentary homolog [Macrosteles quadrilineatus]
MAVARTHFILLIQPSEDSFSRSFSDFETIDELMEGITDIYDDYIKKAFPSKSNITYDLLSILKFVKGLRDISCLEYKQIQNMYIPHSKEWVAQELYKYLAKKHAEENRFNA